MGGTMQEDAESHGIISQRHDFIPSVVHSANLRERIVKTSDDESDTVYCRGFSGKRFSDEDVVEILSMVERPCEIDFTKRQRFGITWVKYRHVRIAHETILRLHQSMQHGVSISLRFELGVDSNGKPIVPKASHCTVVRHIMYKGQPYSSAYQSKQGGVKQVSQTAANDVEVLCRPCEAVTQTPKESGIGMRVDSVSDVSNWTVTSIVNSSDATSLSKNVASINYSHKSIVVGNDLELPFPSGLYLTRLIALSRKRDIHPNDPLLTLLTTSSLSKFQHKYAKEISEVMAMVDAVERGMKLAFGKSPQEHISPTSIAESASRQVTVYVLGDGQIPLCAAALCLHFPSTWRYYSIDPILVPIDVTDLYQHRFHQIPSMSQDFFIPSHVDSNLETTSLSIVVACHSHAPLQEFWDRMSSPKLAIVMPCCASYSHLSIDALFEFDDFEVYSAKRHIQIFAQKENTI